jgi:hypothetical protein
VNTTEKQATVAGRAAGMDAREFSDWIEQRLVAQKEILESVAEQVANANLEPLVGARIASCVAGSVFGYEEFHPRAGAPAAEQVLDQQLLEKIGSRSRS